MNRPKNLPAQLLLFFAIETLSVTWCLKIPGWAPFLSLLYCASGMGIAYLLTRCPTLQLPSRGKKSWTLPINHYRLIITGCLALATWSWCQYWFDEMPIDITNADMLPIIKVMGERFIAGQHSHVYDIIPSIWHGTQPIYLPAMWLPYVPAIFLGLDMRWIAVAGLFFAFITFLFLYRPPARHHQPNHPHDYKPFFLGALAFLLYWWVVADNTAGIVSVAEEGMVIGYYVLLVLALVSGKPWLTGIAISLCMLSRYALVGWLPAYLIYLAMEKKWRECSIITLTGILCFVLLFLLPVGLSTFVRLAKLPGDYVAFACRVWKDSPDVFATAPAFASFFGPNRVGLLHSLLVSLSFIIPPLFVLIGRRLHGNNLPLASLKLALVIFYCFIDVPYLYLFYTSSFVSLIALTLVLHEPA
ncbi:hypothetical protein [Puia dinghuensis]|uniref:Uncharacterized protein n=1 Tax=Puia dinghuensis TaxID=1792502 RepID=A0A8J2UFZ8_9BACT|nr:hypothetical protein [Puia dinghuensis]GGB11977.1 hypothetical protein GCM10011511_39470 [Puia dinghuensis]